jgi:predicted N-formylglutamate amidohydrolase
MGAIMNGGREEALLSDGDPDPVGIVNPSGRSSFLLIGDHAGRAIPARLGTLGLSEAELGRHIGWDIGIATLGPMLAGTLDAVFIRQTYSRLVIDCNRDPDAPDAIPECSDGTEIPGNLGLDSAGRAARAESIHQPYQAAIGAEIARRDSAGMATILIALHSFTPIMAGAARPWQAGVLHSPGTSDFALRLLATLRRDPGLTVGDNQPYAMDGTDHSVPRHAFAPPRPYAEIEIRQDLIGDEAGAAAWTARLADALRAAAAVD